MKKIIAITLLSAVSLVSAMDKQIVLPTAEIIKQNLKEIGMPDNAIIRLDYHTEFGGKTMSVEEIVQRVESINVARINATEESKREWATKHTLQMTPLTVKALLKNSPEAAELVLKHREDLK